MLIAQLEALESLEKEGRISLGKKPTTAVSGRIDEYRPENRRNSKVGAGFAVYRGYRWMRASSSARPVVMRS